MLAFLSGLFGGAGLGVILGFILGARAQRQLGLIFKLEAQKARKVESDLIFEDDEAFPKKGLEHPIGPVPPKPDQVAAHRRKNPLAWMNKRT